MNLRHHLLAGQVIPAHPLALDAGRRFSERHQRALTRYYLAAGCGGLAVGVHSTQFQIRDPKHGLYRPVLELAAATVKAEAARLPHEVALIAGICGRTPQAVREAELAHSLGYQAILVSMGAFKDDPEEAVVAHLRTLADIVPLFAFYLQPAVGGRLFSPGFWRQVAEIEALVGIKVAPFNRYQTLDVVQAVMAAGREDVALYTGNDDTIVADLLTPFPGEYAGRPVTRRFVGGLLGHWGVWARSAVLLHASLREAATHPAPEAAWWGRNAAVTDMNGALFDAAHNYAGCIPGILEVLRRQGLVETAHCLDPHERLSPGQAEELTRVCRQYPEFTDDAFVAEHRDAWLR